MPAPFFPFERVIQAAKYGLVYDPTRFIEDILTKYSDAHTVLTRLSLEVEETCMHHTGVNHHKINKEVIKKADDLSQLIFMKELISIRDLCAAINLRISEIEKDIWGMATSDPDLDEQTKREFIRKSVLGNDSIEEMANKLLLSVHKLRFRCKLRFILNLTIAIVFASSLAAGAMIYLKKWLPS